MINPDEYYDNIAARMQRLTSSTGEVERSFWQHVGKTTEPTVYYQGHSYDEMIYAVNRMMQGLSRDRHEGQNKKTELEKLQEKGRENG